MKNSLVFVPPSVQTAAERILLSTAYQVYHFPVADGTSDVNPSPLNGALINLTLVNQILAHRTLVHRPLGYPTLVNPPVATQTLPLESAEVSEHGNTNAPPFQPGSKVCLSYNRYPELYVVLAVAYPPGSAPKASSSAPTSPVEDVAASLETATISGSDATESAATEAGNVTANNADAETADASSTTQTTTSTPAATNPKYIYLVLPNDAAKLKPTVDLTQSKVVSEERLINPPLFAVGRVLQFPVASNKYDNEHVILPVEIKKVVNNIGLDMMGGEPETTEWKYKFQHGMGWVPESVLMSLYEFTSAGALD